MSPRGLRRSRGYAELLRTLDDPDDREHAERVEWLDWIGRGEHEPDAFDLSSFADDLNIQQSAKLGDWLD